ncbi:MAG: immunoglobulin domain-containing protein, partial [Cytophagaceae bacterium]
AIKIVVPRGGVGVLTLDSPNGENTPEGIDVHLNGTFIGGYHLYENPNCAEGVEGCTVQDFDYSKVVGVQFMVTNRDNGGAAPWHPQALDNANLAITSMRFGGDCDRDASLPDPVIDVQPISQSVDEGDEAIFTVVASGDGDITYQWYRNDQPIPSAESASYTIPSASMADAGDYYVIVTMNGQTVTSDEVTLTVTPLPAATIDVQPVSQTAVEGDEVTLSVTASGEGTITYQWYRNGEPIPSAESANYTIPSASMADAGEYYVVVTMNGQTVTSDEVTLTVTPPPAASIDVQPIGQTAIVGDEVVFSVQASGDGAITYQWYFNGSPISNADGASLTIPSAQLSDAGSYYVVVTMNGQDVQSNTVGLTVNETPPATITVQPVGQSVVVGEELVISVEATGDGNITYQWYHNGTAIPNAENASLTISSAGATDEGSYYVVVTMDGAVVQSDAVILIVNDPPTATIDAQPSNQTATEGEEVVLSVDATVEGDGDVTYVWYHNGAAIDGENGSSYVIPSTSADHQGNYYVEVLVDGVVVAVTDPFTLDVNPTSVFNRADGANYTLYPNPVMSGDVLIFSNMINNVTVYDAKGNVVERAANMDLLNTGNYTPGIYVILSDEGARRFIVK